MKTWDSQVSNKRSCTPISWKFTVLWLFIIEMLLVSNINKRHNLRLKSRRHICSIFFLKHISNLSWTLINKQNVLFLYNLNISMNYVTIKIKIEFFHRKEPASKKWESTPKNNARTKSQHGPIWEKYWGLHVRILILPWFYCYFFIFWTV